MDGTYHGGEKRVKKRDRFYSSMNYAEYETYFGTPPKMPQAPTTKPMLDPLEIPPMSLEDETEPSRDSTVKKQPRKIYYNIEPIPQIEGSENNSVTFQSPHYKNLQLGINRLSSKLQLNGDDLQQIKAVKRPPYRQRSYSENSPFISKIRIIDFLSDSKNNKGKKQVKPQ